MDWDDLKFLIAVADAGALAPAARAMRVDASTVSRRITALERALSAELVARTPEGMTLTETGQLAVDAARKVEAELAALRAAIGGERSALAGVVRVSSTDSLAPLVMRAMAPLHEKCPELTIEVLPTSAQADLRRREADIAVRMFRDDHDGIALRKLGHMGWSLYATPEYLARHPPGSNLLEGHEVVGYSEALSKMAGAIWLAQHARPESIRLRCGSTRAALDATLAHLGTSILPCFLTAGHPLKRLTDQVLALTDVYAVFLPERRGEARLRVVIDALVELFVREGTLLGG